MPKQARADNNLQITHPDIAKRWHPSRNNGKTPRDFTQGSGKKAWWLCDKKHEYEAVIQTQTRGHSCPYCSGRSFLKGHSLADLFPTLALEWHPIKNIFTSDKISPHSSKKVWWHCSRGHEWDTAVHNRTKGHACRYCSPGTSNIELRFFAEIKYVFPTAEQRARPHGLECDIFVKKYPFGIEIDGFHFHKEKLEKDKQKREKLQKYGIHLFNVRGQGLQKVGDNDIFFDEMGSPERVKLNLHKATQGRYIKNF
jgi:DNA-directed RNA polymerase subunit RPC12/RpoP